MHAESRSELSQHGVATPWAIVLAGGDGVRLEAESVARYGYPRPKQFCDYDGCGTLLHRTLVRARALVSPTRIVVVTTRRWEREAREVLALWPDAVHLQQPKNLGTTPGVVLPLIHILRIEPDTRVIVLPSDHVVRDEGAFLSGIRLALGLVATWPAYVALLGALPTEVEPGHGWVVPRELPGEPWLDVAAFQEKPGIVEAGRLQRAGALINTFVMIGYATTLANLVRRHRPACWAAFVQASMDRAHREHVFETFTHCDFSRAILAEAHNLRVVPVAAGRADVGTPARLHRA